MKEFSTEIDIEAPPERVWSVLVDTANWPSFDPFSDGVEGSPVLGQRVKVFSKLSPGRAFPVTVTALDRPHRMVWSDGMPFGLFRGERTYTITPRGTGSHFTMQEVFTGPMLKLIGKSLPDMTESFQAFAKGLKDKSEGRIGGQDVG
jgi:uncharacterized protein YndB with AHSA1/START domain